MRLVGSHGHEGADAAPNGDAQLPTAGLLLSLPMNDDPTDGVFDATGGGAAVGCKSCPTLKGGAYHFSADQCLEVTPQARFNTSAGFSVAVWVEPAAIESWIHTIAAKVYGAGQANSWNLHLLRTIEGTVGGCAAQYVFETTNGVGFQKLRVPESYPVGVWWHVVATWDGSVKRLYLNGVEVASAADTTVFDDGPILIGCDQDDGVRRHFFSGALRDFRLYDRALTPAEVAQFSAGFTFSPPTPIGGVVEKLVLVDPVSDLDVAPLVDGSTITVPPEGINVRAQVKGPVGSVVFGLDANASFHVENDEPFALGGDAAGNILPWYPTSGLRTISATPFCGAAGAGPKGAPLVVQVTFQ